MGLEKVNFFCFESKFKIEFFFGRRWGGGGMGVGGGWLEQVKFFFTENPIFFLGGGGGGGGPEWGVGGRTDEQAQAFKCDLGLQPR